MEFFAQSVRFHRPRIGLDRNTRLSRPPQLATDDTITRAPLHLGLPPVWFSSQAIIERSAVHGNAYSVGHTLHTVGLSGGTLRHNGMPRQMKARSRTTRGTPPGLSKVSPDYA